MKDLLLEIGVEEVPARFLPGTIENLKASAGEKFRARNIAFSNMEVYVTPRRIALLAEDLPESQPDIVKEVFGPPKKIAFDAEGKPTKAAIGFAKSAGAAPEKLFIKEKNSGEYVAALIEEKGRPTREILPEVLREIVLSLNFPKSMRWGDGSMRFVRPVRWMMALFDFEIVEFELDGIKSSNITKGHRFLSPVAFQIREARSYKKILETSFVIADQDKRRSMILGDLDRLAASAGGKPVLDEDLLNTVVHLVEYPVGVLCEFSKEYLELPEELLITVMKDHQKYFAVRGDNDRLLNNFIVISNTLRENSFVVRAGSERVIKARFEDARFYYHDDLKKPIGGLVEKLKKVSFHEKLGSVYEKVQRIRKIASFISSAIYPGVSAQADRAALLSKSDLISGVVREFPELQGAMGRYYAVNDGEPEDVAEAIMEQYLPRHTGDALPSTRVGTVLALADRLDNIASFFFLGLAPSGSEDPFALRRQAIAVLMVLIENELELTIRELVKNALDGLGQKENAALEADILRFFESRLPQIFEARGYGADIIDSVLAMAVKVPLKYVLERMEALKGFKKSAACSPFLKAVKRIRNIVPPEELPPVNTALFREEQEKGLYDNVLSVEKNVRGLLSEHMYERALAGLAELTPSINGFFDAVLVMDKDRGIKANRLSLLKRIWALALEISDLSKLSEV